MCMMMTACGAFVNVFYNLNQNVVLSNTALLLVTVVGFVRGARLDSQTMQQRRNAASAFF